jgi:hypothetical protein
MQAWQQQLQAAEATGHAEAAVIHADAVEEEVADLAILQGIVLNFQRIPYVREAKFICLSFFVKFVIAIFGYTDVRYLQF